MNSLKGYFDHLHEHKFRGQVIVTFKDGQISLLEQKQQFKSIPQEILSRKNRQESHVVPEGPHEFPKQFSKKM
ncbi:hypothetical protein AZI87_17115 [Bdellovibrio bacteriovorus]|uniref:Uncharacterized protein n=1 Tax=Bdellovibrio bacteriovorus TaxID=959 RepID=A0A162G0T3_BDEBC|nr:hypothetical protein [Bdellovibrio bacteriovorus]KYG62981.1 hypothetical protein AZI87_17115 [Bdellovibrio bacteriovorus]